MGVPGRGKDGDQMPGLVWDHRHRVHTLLKMSRGIICSLLVLPGQQRRHRLCPMQELPQGTMAGRLVRGPAPGSGDGGSALHDPASVRLAGLPD